MASDNNVSGHVLKIAIRIMIIVLFMSSSAKAATSISSCITISSPGEYMLSKDILEITNSSCINIVSSDVIFDGAGHKIDGIYHGKGIYVYNSTNALRNITIRSLSVTDWNDGIYYKDIQNGTLTNNTALDNIGGGIFLDYSSNITLSNNTVSNNFYGIYLWFTSNSTLSYNTALENSFNGIILQAGRKNILNYNTVSKTFQGSGIFIGSDNSELKGNTVRSSAAEGIYIGSHNNILSNNIVSNNEYAGIDIAGSSNNVIDGNIANLNNEYGIDLFYANNNLINNNTANSNTFFGISIQESSNNTLINNTVNFNRDTGIKMFYFSRNNTLKNNIMSNNKYNFGANGIFNPNNESNRIDTSNLVDGIPIYYIKGAENTVYDSSTNFGTFYCIDCVNVTVENVSVSTNGVGIYFFNTTFSKIQNVKSNNNEDGIELEYSGNNALSGNNVSNNFDGIHLDYSSNNTLSGNNASNNLYYGIDLYYSSNNTLNSNIANSNYYYGIYQSHSSKNDIYDNFFNNSRNYYIHDSFNSWNTTRMLDTNIVGGPYLAGNFWSNPNGKGYSQICTDSNKDGICDSEYTLDANNIDYFPLSMNFIQPDILIYTYKTNYVAGDEMKIGLNITNPGSAVTVSMEIWLDLPTGGKKVVVAYPSVPLPAGLDWNKYPLLKINMPDIPAGNYSWHALLKDPVSGGIISESISPWTFSRAATGGNGSQEELEKALQIVPEEIFQSIELNID